MRIHIERSEKTNEDPDPKGLTLAVREIGGSEPGTHGLLLTTGAVSAWYRLAGTPYLYRTLEEQKQILREVAHARVGHVGKHVHERVTQRRYGPNEWGRLYTEANASIGLTPAPAGPGG